MVTKKSQMDVVRKTCDLFAPKADEPPIDFSRKELYRVEIEKNCAYMVAVFKDFRECKDPPYVWDDYLEFDATCCGYTPPQPDYSPEDEYYYIRIPRLLGKMNVVFNWKYIPLSDPLPAECGDWLGPWADY